MSVFEVLRDDPRFYDLVGRLALSLEVKRDGLRLVDTPEKRWWVAVADVQPIGVCAAEPRKSLIRMCSMWVDPAWRGLPVIIGGRTTTIAGELARRRFDSLDGDLESVATEAVAGYLSRCGFVEHRRRGRYRIMRRMK